MTALHRPANTRWLDSAVLGFVLLAALALSSCTSDRIARIATSSPTGLPTSTPSLTVPPTRTSQPTVTQIAVPPTQTSTPTLTPQPTPKLGKWTFTGAYARGSSPCAKYLSSSTFILGADASNCLPSKQGGTATAKLSLPSGFGDQSITLRVICSTTLGCASAITNHTAEGKITVSVDGRALWTVRCKPSVGCDPLALGDAPTVTFFSTKASQHTIELSASAGITWPVEALEVDAQVLPKSIEGVAYSPFRDCQNPHWGPEPSLEEVQEDLRLLRNMGNAVRTYASTGIQGKIPALARQMGLRVSAGAQLGRDKEKNEQEIAALITVAKTVDLEAAIVGNEVLLRGDLTEDELLGYIQRVRAAIPVSIPVTTGEIGSTLLAHPRIMRAVDLELVHLYAYWDGIPIENAALHVVDLYHRIQATVPAKRVVIGETGWPASGQANGLAIPSPKNQRRFLREFLALARKEGLEFFYFSVFDELWKTEGGVGPYWGFMTSDRRNKYDVQSLLYPLNDTPHPLPDVTPLPTGTPGPRPVAATVFPVFRNYASEENHFAPSGWMGDIGAIHFNDCARLTEDWDDRVIEIQYSPSAKDQNGWAGIYWQEPENNWGNLQGGYALSGFTRLKFRARSDQDGVRVKFLVGGVDSGPFPSSLLTPVFAQGADSLGFVTLSRQWQEYSIDLRGADLSHLIDGFGWIAQRDAKSHPITVYLDEIVFDQQPPQPDSQGTTNTIGRASQLPVFINGSLAQGFDLGLQTSEEVSGWATNDGSAMKLVYPPGQKWSVAYITVGRPQSTGPRQVRDLSSYQTLTVDMRGEVGEEVVQIGMKDAADPDDGSETKKEIQLTSEWQTFRFPLREFVTADLTHIHVPIEFVFPGGAGSETIYFRNVRFVAGD